MRALLVYNPVATMTDERVRDVIASALSSQVGLDVVATRERGHATDMVRKSVADGVDVVFALGGDGTSNEVIQATAGTDVAMGLIPGGSTNVLARALGLPNDAVRATSQLLDALREGRTRTIGLGSANGRYFGIIAGFGFDAAVVRAVESNAWLKSRTRQLSFVTLGLRQWFAAGDPVHQPSISVDAPGPVVDRRFGVAVVGNADPYTYLGSRPLSVTPNADFDAGLDLTAITEVDTARILALLSRAFRAGRLLESDRVSNWHDLDSFTLTSTRDLPWQVDGDYAGLTRTVAFRSHPAALRVLL